jgi:FecR protein
MKNIQKSLAALVCGLTLALTAGSFAQEIKQGIVTVVRVQGEASYTLGGNDNWHPLVVGKILHAGASIKTETDALVDVVLGQSVAMPQAHPTPNRIGPAPDAPVRGMTDYTPSAEQNVVRLSGNTTLKVDKLTVSDTGVDTVSDTELDLQQGRIFASVKKLSGASQYLVKIPNGIAGVRGTKFGLGADGMCAVIKSSVLLSLIGADGRPFTVLVGEGNQFNPGTGQIAPLSPELANILQQIATAVDTLYFEAVSFAFNRVEVYISPTTGRHGANGNQGGNNGGGGNQGGELVLQKVP